MGISILSYYNTPEKINLQDAIQEGRVKAEFSSTGYHSGDAINIKITWLKGRKQNLLVEAGSLFKSENEEEQDIFILDNQEIFANNQQSIIKGYCCQSQNSSPQEGSSFALGKSNNKELLALASFCNGKPIDDHSLQAAVWTLSNNKPISDIYNTENVQVKALRKKVAQIANIKDDWYNTKSDYELAEDRSIVRSPVEVTGNLIYEAPRSGKIAYTVHDKNGVEIRNIGDGLPIPRAGSYTIKFSLKVEGWESGEYQVKLTLRGETIHTQTFEV